MTRNTVSSTEPTTRQAALALAVGAIAAPFAVAHADVITTTTDQDFAGGTPATISFDGVTAFTITSDGVITASGSNLIATGTGTINGNPEALKLNSGQSVANSFALNGGASTAAIGSLLLNKNGFFYVGLEVINGSTDYFGWAQITGQNGVNYSASDVESYVFETSQGVDITTPASDSVPEPASLGMLAMGAVAAAAIRRRGRKSVAA